MGIGQVPGGTGTASGMQPAGGQGKGIGEWRMEPLTTQSQKRQGSDKEATRKPTTAC